MLSILIPVRNYDCTRLVLDLKKQADALKLKREFDYEIIVSDDASDDDASLLANREMERWSHCRYCVQPKNLGRAANCNFMIEAARHPWVLIIDCDAQVERADFLEKYWLQRSVASVLIGGLTTPKVVSPGCELRHRYELRAERRHTPQFRQKNPYAHFSTFNIMAQRDVLRRTPFDSRCTDYGYEDALMGLELKRLQIPVAHIDNPLVHLGIDHSEEYLCKTETAMHTLLGLDGMMQETAGASRMAHRLHSLGMERLFARLFCALRPCLQRHLTGRKPSLLIFNLYKLGYYCLLDTQRRRGG